MGFYLNPVHRKSLESVGLDYVLDLKRDLRVLACRIGDNIRFELAGGLAIPLTLEQHAEKAKDFFKFPNEGHAVYRPHNAFHLSIYECHLSRLEERFSKPSQESESKYILVTRPASWHLLGSHSETKADYYKPVSAKEALGPVNITKRTKNLRFVRVVNGKLATPHKERLDYVDIYPYRFENGQGEAVKLWHGGKFNLPGTERLFSPSEVYVVSWDSKKEPLKLRADYYNGASMQGDGFSLNIAALHWVRLVKEKREKQDPVDQYDMGLIDEFYKAVPVEHAYS